ncbi:hypothetical protein PPERSA_01768 [Pseudocohnilembus persalinus]|uniref:Choline transporter-like protein n=1 Tax=Pseudocohnilembus persalinus TaxID=266149 RepID=A0A0V0R1B6_PSEPJ|nr:hypothetical protein PPERSA_01768 [Pseudocohnilembus persalinus]|eukprot:KRX08307.1 hypothetical protein PPERSA_01768 [Pseudocohnilembus persalinus]
MLLNSKINRMDSGQFDNYDSRFMQQPRTFQQQEIQQVQQDPQINREEYQNNQFINQNEESLQSQQVQNRPKQQTQYFNDEVEEIQYEQESENGSQKNNIQENEPLELNPQLRDGPIVKRQCTNLSWLIFFIFSTCIMIAIATVSSVFGHPDRLTQPYDPSGRACGVDNGVEDAPYIYMAVPYEGYFHRSVCVRECPNWSDSETSVTQLDCVTNNQVSTCYETLPINNCNFPSGCSSSDDLENAVFIYSTSVYFGRICLSSDTDIIENTQLSQVFDVTRLQQYFSDLLVARWALTGSAFIAYTFGFSFCVLMIFLPHILTWLGVIVYFLMVALLGVVFMMKGQDFKTLQQEAEDPTAENSYYLDSIYLRTLSYVFFGIFILSFVGLICIFKHLKLAIKIIKTAQQFVKDTLEIIWIPALLGISLIGQWAIWITIFLYGFSCGKLVNLSENELGPFGTLDVYDGADSMLWYWFLGGLLTHAVLMVLGYIDKQARPLKEEQEPSEIAKCISRCLLCFMGCYENCIKYMNKSGYVYVAITGDDFMKSSKLAYQVYERNAQKYETIIGTAFSIDAILQCAQFDEEIYQPIDLAAQHTPSALLEFMNEMGIFDTHFKSRNSVLSKQFYSEAISQD